MACLFFMNMEKWAAVYTVWMTRNVSELKKFAVSNRERVIMARAKYVFFCTKKDLSNKFFSFFLVLWLAEIGFTIFCVIWMKNHYAVCAISTGNKNMILGKGTTISIYLYWMNWTLEKLSSKSFVSTGLWHCIATVQNKVKSFLMEHSYFYATAFL